MSRGSYGYVGRRSGGAAWQWVIIGMVIGFGCSVVLVLGGLATGYLALQPEGVVTLPTQTPFVITATPAPVTATVEPTLAPATATQAISVNVPAPSATPTIDATFLTLQATVQTTQSVAIGQQVAQGATNASNSGGNLFARLNSIVSDTVPVDGGSFEMGTTPSEVSQAVADCKNGYGGEAGNCDVSMGEDAYPQHSVTLSTFSIERTEVTYAQFLAFMNALGPGRDRNGCDGGQPCMQTRNESETSNVQFDGANYSVPVVINDYPMADVTWYGADAYCKAIGRRLPTEAEWEYAARGNKGNIYPWGNDWDPTKASTKRPATGEASTVPVNSFPTGASPFGALNMAGNVAEWVSDWYDPQFYGRPEATIADPTGPVSGTEKVVRGGSWDAVPFFSRTMSRQSAEPGQPAAWIGFRCVEAANSQAATENAPIGANTNTTNNSSDLGLQPTNAAGIGNSEENNNNSAPTLPPPPTVAAPTTANTGPATPHPTLQPGG